ncbi:MAG: hypothetical protein ACTSUR_05230 [Candidatus Heimdallarchaeaceae archaeon]
MKKKWKIIISSTVILGVCCALIPLLFFSPSQPPTDTEFVFPNVLLNNGSCSDIIVENDDIVHLGIRNDYNLDNYGPAYARLNLEDTSDVQFEHKAILPNAMFSGFYQIRIILDPTNNPLIYFFHRDAFGFDRADFWVENSPKWEYAQFFNNSTLRLLADGPLFNWFFLPSGKIIYSHIYWNKAITYPKTTPILYNQSSREILLLNNTFSEIQSVEAYGPGDFCLTDSSYAILWTRYSGMDSYHPNLAINWGQEGWQLYKIGDETKQYFAKRVISDGKAFYVFYYDQGENSKARLFMKTVYNSTFSTETLLSSFDGVIYFHDESICMPSPNCFIFLYSKSLDIENKQYDLYMGIYNNSQFKEIQLTNTPTHNEYWANCEMGKNYLHYTWSCFDYNSAGEIIKYSTKLYYNRTTLAEIESFSNTTPTQKYSMNHSTRVFDNLCIHSRTDFTTSILMSTCIPIGKNTNNWKKLTLSKMRE